MSTWDLVNLTDFGFFATDLPELTGATGEEPLLISVSSPATSGVLTPAVPNHGFILLFNYS